jgi:septum formation protein
VAPRLILASGSPRRRELLAEAGFTFDVIAPEVREISTSDLTVAELTACNALRKARAVAREYPNDVVLAADTIVSLGTEAFGKPADMHDARRILRRLSDRTHEVYSAVFICKRSSGRRHVFYDVSRVRFRRLSESAISDYFAKINPLDKAGAYAAQGHGTEIIERIDGSFTNVVGLPMEKTIRVLRDFGVVAWFSQRA